MLRIKVMAHEHGFVLAGSEIPVKIRSGADLELYISPSDLLGHGVSEALSREGETQLLAAGTVLMSYVSTGESHSAIIRSLKVSERPASTTPGFVQLVLKDSLILQFKPPRLPMLRDARCWIPSLSRETESVNEAYTRISEAFETRRRSHQGNVFVRVYCESADKENHWVPLERLRTNAESRFFNETISQIDKAQANHNQV